LVAVHSPALDAWSNEGRWYEIAGRRIWCSDGGEPGPRPALVCLHGFPSFSHDFHRVLPALRAKGRVVVHDHLGFGLSDKPEGHDYSLIEQANIALGLWARLGIERATLLAHDYGTSVATEILAQREEGQLSVELEGVILSNGSMHIELAHLTWPQLVLQNHTLGPILGRIGPRALFERRLRKTFHRSPEPEDIRMMWHGLVANGGRKVLGHLGRYLHERRAHWDRWIGALTRLDLPIHILWGRQDSIAVEAIAQQLERECPESSLEWLEGVGHYPMLEAPAAWAGCVEAFWAGPAPRA
jgi:pimeloyl-ACP methyl ester carboxylesterase